MSATYICKIREKKKNCVTVSDILIMEAYYEFSNVCPMIKLRLSYFGLNFK